MEWILCGQACMCAHAHSVSSDFDGGLNETVISYFKNTASLIANAGLYSSLFNLHSFTNKIHTIWENRTYGLHFEEIYCILCNTLIFSIKGTVFRTYKPPTLLSVAAITEKHISNLKFLVWLNALSLFRWSLHLYIMKFLLFPHSKMFGKRTARSYAI
jgi:hypothetical protein